MRLTWYSLLIVFLPSFSYAIYWTQFTDSYTSRVPAIVVVILGVALFAVTVYLVIVRTHSFKKLGISGELQEPEN